MRVLLLLLLSATTLHAQWQIQDSHSTASFRGVHALGKGVAWVSGTQGTILRTVDDGKNWQACAVPPNAEKLDFRGIQAFDAMSAIVMSSGKGDLSRLYKTTDGCKTWWLILSNPDAPNDGFFDALLFLDQNLGLVFGDPAHGSGHNPVEGSYFAFRIRVTPDGGKTWIPVSDPESNSPGKNLQPASGEGLFAASNSSASISDGWLWIGTGGGRILKRRLYSAPANKPYAFRSHFCAGAIDPISHECGIPWVDWTNMSTPLSAPGQAAGIFSLVFRSSQVGIAVGGDYQKPDQSISNAAFSDDGGRSWQAVKTPPSGYRSSVAYDSLSQSWITVGPNGTDVSSDDGKNWRALEPSATGGDVGEDRDWNALSLPFVVGPKGRIGRLRAKAAGAAKP